MKPTLVALFAFSISVLSACVEADTIQGQASVIDGDTIDIHNTRIRLHGIDAPESSQRCLNENGQNYRCGRDSAFALDDLIGNKVVSCVERDVDRYGRIIAVCYVGETNLNNFLVRAGLAVAYRQYSNDYVAAEREARSARRGLWRGQFDLPWNWRRNQ